MGSESFVASQVETLEATGTPRIERFKFSGSGKEYFGIWIVNIFLTIITLGIYSAWAKVRNNQYFYGNTYLDNASFEYTATPMQILRGRIIAFAIFVIYALAENFLPLVGVILALLLFLVSPWVIMKSLAFKANYSQYRNIRFVFHQDLMGAYKTFIFLPVLAFLPAILFFIAMVVFIDTPDNQAADHAELGFLGLLPFAMLLAGFLAYPFITYIANRYIVSNHAYGGEDFRFRVKSPKPYYKIYFAALAFGILFAVLLMAGWFSIIKDVGEEITDENWQALTLGLVTKILLIYLIAGSTYAFLIAYVKARSYNLVHQNTAVGKHKLRAKISVLDLTFLYITNTLGIAVTLGLFIPWAKVRTARFLANNTALQVSGDLNSFVATQSEYQNSLGEELGDVFDLDIVI